jgi:hypothetical protein
VFSKGRLVLSHVRNQLTVESTRALMCLNAWSKLGLVNRDDVKMAVSQPEVEEGEGDIEDEFDIL